MLYQYLSGKFLYSLISGGVCRSDLVSGFLESTPVCAGRILESVDCSFPPIDAVT
jgi:hypothetical protein